MPEEDASAQRPNPPSLGDGGVQPVKPNDQFSDSLIQAALSPPPAAPHTGSRAWQPPTVKQLQASLPQYEIRQFLARGGMGAVYKGWQKSLERSVAIKILPPDIEGENVNYVERFKHEAKAMAKLRHPGIVAVYDAGETADGLLYFVMEHVEGTDVAQRLAAQGRLPDKEALLICWHVCDALVYAHAKGFVHRDIKPSNIMLENDGTVRVADFGLAKALNDDSATLTRSNLALGTPDFIAPETLIPGIKIDGRADLYAVGVMLYQMLTGQIPRGRFQLPSGIVPQISPRLDAVVDKAMQTDRERRYASAAEMKGALGVLMADGDPAASAERAHQNGATAPQQRKKSRQHFALLVVAVIAIVAVAAFYLFHQPNRTAHAAAGHSAVGTPGERTAIKLWDTEEKVPKEKAVRWENGAMVLGDGIDKGELHWEKPRSRDAIIRADIRTNPDSEYASIRLRYNATESQGDSYRLELHRDVVSLSVLVNGNPRDLQAWHYPKTYGPDEWAHLELKAVGDVFTASLDGQVLGSVEDYTLRKPGGVMIVGRQNAYFRNVEYVPLDKPEASPLAASKLEPNAIRLWDSVSKLPDNTGAKWEDNAVRLEGVMLENYAPLAKDAVLRASVKMNPDSRDASISLRGFNNKQSKQEGRYSLAIFPEQQTVALQTLTASTHTALATWPLPRAYGADEWARVELRIVGDAITALIDGQVLGTVRDNTLSDAGHVQLWALKAGYFRDIVFVPLDRPSALLSEQPWLPLLNTPEAVASLGISGMGMKDGWVGLVPHYVYLIRLAGGKQKVHDMAFRATIHPSGNEWPVVAVLHSGAEPQYNLDIHHERLSFKRISQVSSANPIYTNLAEVPVTLSAGSDGSIALEVSIENDRITVLLDGKKVIDIREEGVARAGDISLSAASGTNGTAKIKDLFFRMVDTSGQKAP